MKGPRIPACWKKQRSPGVYSCASHKSAYYYRMSMGFGKLGLGISGDQVGDSLLQGVCAGVLSALWHVASILRPLLQLMSRFSGS